MLESRGPYPVLVWGCTRTCDHPLAWRRPLDNPDRHTGNIKPPATAYAIRMRVKPMEFTVQHATDLQYVDRCTVQRKRRERNENKPHLILPIARCKRGWAMMVPRSIHGFARSMSAPLSPFIQLPRYREFHTDELTA